MENLITIKSEDWLKNAGICGLYNILVNAGDKNKINVDAEEISFPVELLENFSEKYFNYFIETYGKIFSIYKITSFENVINNWLEKDFEVFNDESLKLLNSQIEEFKKYMKSNSYKSAYDLIGGDFNPELKEKELKKIILKKKETVVDRLDEIKTQVVLMKNIVSYFKEENTKKYIGAKNAIYNVIRNAWDGVSFLNRQCKNPDMYDEYQQYFVNSAIEYANSYEETKSKYKYQCVACSSKIKDLNSDIGFIREMGFDTNRKTSHVWDFNNYIAICPICKLIYSCVPAGINYVYSRGIFVNYSMELEELFRINNRIKNDVWNYENGNTSIYKALQENMSRSINDKSGYELSDVQVVRFYRDMDKDSIKYNFNIINKQILETINSCSKELEIIKKGSYIENKDFVYIYNEVMKRLLDNENQFLLIQKLLHYKLSMPDSTYYGNKMIHSVIKINLAYLEEVGCMTRKDWLLREAVKIGRELQAEYNRMEGIDNTNSEDNKKFNKKLGSIAYKMLNALNTNNKGLFMNIFIKAYSYTGKSVPIIFAENQYNDLEFKSMGYAFVNAMIGRDKEENKKTEIVK